MADNDHVWNLETCKKNTLKFKVKRWKLAGKCFDLWVVIPKIGKVSQQKTFLIEFVFDRERQEPNKLFSLFPVSIIWIWRTNSGTKLHCFLD